jgi:TolB-like protein/Flp pilus assembly protein TadD
LPFQNLSADGPHSYFAGGLHDELLTQLSKVAALSLRGRTSVMGYAGTTKAIREIAQELSVASIVEGSVQVVGNRLRVNVQLIDAVTDEHLWAESYDRTLDDAFAIQSDIARQVVAAVGATLTGTEARAMAAAPTDNPEAYRLYLQGLEFFNRPGRLQRDTEVAQGLFERGLSQDSAFALAYAALSQAHGRMWWWGYDRSPERLALQQQAAETALRLAPDLSPTRVAMGYVHYWGRQDFHRALEEFEAALRGMPNDAELRANIAYVHRRLGNWDEVLDAFETALALDPRNVNHINDLSNTFTSLGRYPEAVEWLTHGLALAPDVAGYDVQRGWTWVLWQGRLDSLAAALNRHPPDADLGARGSAREWNARWLLLERQPDSLLALLLNTPHRVFERQGSYLPTSLLSAWAHELRGDGPAALDAFGSARIQLDSVLAVLPDDWRVHAARGFALAGLGLREEARREARWLQQSPIYREDAYGGQSLAMDRALILAGIGDTEEALEEIERFLAGPPFLSVHTLRLDPSYDPIRHDPRFQALLVKFTNPEGGG